MRWAQVAFVEDDPGNYDEAFWLDYFQHLHVDAACLSAATAVLLSIPPIFRFTIEANGWATEIPLATS